MSTTTKLTCLWCEKSNDLVTSRGSASVHPKEGTLYVPCCSAHSFRVNPTTVDKKRLTYYIRTLSSRPSMKQSDPYLAGKIRQICNKTKGTKDWDRMETEMTQLAKTVDVDLESRLQETGTDLNTYAWHGHNVHEADTEDDAAVFRRIILARKSITQAYERNKQRGGAEMSVSASKNGLSQPSLEAVRAML